VSDGPGLGGGNGGSPVFDLSDGAHASGGSDSTGGSVDFGMSEGGIDGGGLEGGGAGADAGGAGAAESSSPAAGAGQPASSLPGGTDPGASASVPLGSTPAGTAGSGGTGFSPANVVKALRDAAPDPRFIAGSFLGAGALTAAQVVKSRRDRPGEYLDAGMEQRTGLLGFLSRTTGAGGRHHSVTVGLGDPAGPGPLPAPSPSQAWNAIGTPTAR
jgi:hypothetical protein